MSSKLCGEGNKQEKHREKIDEMKREMEDLKSEVSFLQLYSPLDTHLREPTADILLYSQPLNCDSTHSPSIRVHKAVLMSRSPVFKAMLESEIGSIMIPASYNVVKAFAEFLYKAEIPHGEAVLDLIALGEKYKVKYLKAVCEKIIISHLTCDNAVPMFRYAHLVKSQRLIEVSLNMILKNISTLYADKDFKKLVDKEPRIVAQIFEAYLSRQVSAPSKE